MSSQMSWLHTRAAYYHITYGTEAKPTQNFLPSKEPYFLWKESYFLSKEPYFLWIERTAHPNSTLSYYGTEATRTNFEFPKAADGNPNRLPGLMADDFEQVFLFKDATEWQMYMMPYVVGHFLQKSPIICVSFERCYRGRKCVWRLVLYFKRALQFVSLFTERCRCIWWLKL